MSTSLERRLSVLSSIFVVASVGFASAKSGKAARCGGVTGTVCIDLRTGRVGELDLRSDWTEIAKVVGEKRFKRDLASLQAEDNPDGPSVYWANVTFQDAELALWQNDGCTQVKISTPKFRTSEGVGVGSTWGQVKQAYRDADLKWNSQTGSIESKKYSLEFMFGKHNFSNGVESFIPTKSIPRSGARLVLISFLFPGCDENKENQ